MFTPVLAGLGCNGLVGTVVLAHRFIVMLVRDGWAFALHRVWVFFCFFFLFVLLGILGLRRRCEKLRDVWSTSDIYSLRKSHIRSSEFVVIVRFWGFEKVEGALHHPAEQRFWLWGFCVWEGGMKTCAVFGVLRYFQLVFQVCYDCEVLGVWEGNVKTCERLGALHRPVRAILWCWRGSDCWIPCKMLIMRFLCLRGKCEKLQRRDLIGY